MTGTTPLLESIHRTVAERTPLVGAVVDRVTVGDRLILVELDGGGAAGVAHRPDGILDADPSSRPALDTAGWAFRSCDRPRRAVGLATLNALSVGLIEWRAGDPFEALAGDVEAIATVGLFGPAFRKFGSVEVRVIEREPVDPPETPDGVSVSAYAPAEAETAMAGVDVVFVTGSSLIYGGTEAYLEAARRVPDVVLIGATASFVPGPVFDAGATMLAGGRVTDADAIRGRVDAGECGTDLHGEGLEKVYVTRESSPSGIEFG